MKLNICKDCGTELICVGYHKECPDYKKWECIKCKKRKEKSGLKNISGN